MKEVPLVSSRLLQADLTRFLRRESAPVSERNFVLDKTLDAIRLATAVQRGSDTVMVSHDENLLRLAQGLGLAPSTSSRARNSAAAGRARVDA